MQASSDIFLGWLHVEAGIDGKRRDFYARQLKDWKGSAEIEQMVPKGMAVYGRLCGWTLARAHARSGDRIAIAAYLGKGTTFDRALVEFSHAYAEQNERDYKALAQAVESGRIKAQTGRVARRRDAPRASNKTRQGDRDGHRTDNQPRRRVTSDAPAAEFEALFVQSARRVTSFDGAITLHELAPSTLMFSDRPERIVGHLTTKQFIDGWGHGENSFLDDPPNAVLSFLGDRRGHARGCRGHAHEPAHGLGAADIRRRRARGRACRRGPVRARCSSTRSAGR